MHNASKEFCKRHGITESQFTGEEEIGGSLYLGGLQTIPKGFNPTVGGSLDLGGGLKCETKELTEPIPNPIKEPLTWQDGKYICIDGILSEVVKRRGNALQLKGLSRDEIIYAVTNGDFWAHGSTLKKAKEDLKFKIISQKLKNEPIYPDTMITDKHYRLITGACEIGVDQWKKQNNIQGEQIKADQLLEILEKTNAYGLSDFKKLYEINE